MICVRIRWSGLSVRREPFLLRCESNFSIMWRFSKVAQMRVLSMGWWMNFNEKRTFFFVREGASCRSAFWKENFWNKWWVHFGKYSRSTLPSIVLKLSYVQCILNMWKSRNVFNFQVILTWRWSYPQECRQNHHRPPQQPPFPSGWRWILDIHVWQVYIPTSLVPNQQPPWYTQDPCDIWQGDIPISLVLNHKKNKPSEWYRFSIWGHWLFSDLQERNIFKGAFQKSPF